MNHVLPMVFSFLVSGMVAAAFISILVCGALDGLSRLPIFRTRRTTGTVVAQSDTRI
jgi:hypothetical protein